MQSVEEFLAYAINVETEAASRFGQLADAMEACGNRDVGKLFRGCRTTPDCISPMRARGPAFAKFQR